MNETEKNSYDADAGNKLQELGYNSFNKRILNHSDFAKNNCKFTRWSSPIIKTHVEKDHCGKLDYSSSGIADLLIDKEHAIEMVTVDDFLKTIDDDIVEIKLNFTDQKQSLVHYNETLSKRSIYSWGNNWGISHLTNDYNDDGPDMWQCSIDKYKINTRLWYPVNIIANAPWHNPLTEENTVVPVNYVCLGIDQAVAASNIGLELTPQLDDIINVATSPAPFLNDDLKPFVNDYNRQVINTEYSFNPSDKSGWLFVVIKGYVFTRTVIIQTVNKRQQRRYFSFI
jgi:hypothetical protein